MTHGEHTSRIAAHIGPNDRHTHHHHHIITSHITSQNFIRRRTRPPRSTAVGSAGVSRVAMSSTGPLLCEHAREETGEKRRRATKGRWCATKSRSCLLPEARRRRALGSIAAARVSPSRMQVVVRAVPAARLHRELRVAVVDGAAQRRRQRGRPRLVLRFDDVQRPADLRRRMKQLHGADRIERLVAGAVDGAAA